MPTPLVPDYRWNAPLRRYINATTGRIVSNKEIRSALDAVILSSKQETRILTKDLLNGKITLAGWQEQMAFNLKMQTLASYALVKGGWAQMTASDYGKVGGILKREYAYLQRFALQLQSGTVPMDGRVITRAGMYAEATRGIYEDTRREFFTSEGFDLERRILGIADHCNDCVEFANRGWQPINTLPRIGESICRGYCHCHFEFKFAGESS